MIDSLINLLFRCPHHRLTRPMAPISKAGTPHSQSYVVCLDCGKQFAYDVERMRIGKPVARTHEHAVVPPRSATPAKKVALGLLAAAPLAILVGANWKRRGKMAPPSGEKPSSGPPHDSH